MTNTQTIKNFLKNQGIQASVRIGRGSESGWIHIEHNSSLASKEIEKMVETNLEDIVSYYTDDMGFQNSRLTVQKAW